MLLCSSAECTLAQSKLEDWRSPHSSNLVLMELPGGDVWIELAPQFAPAHVENIKQLIQDNYFDGLHVIRSQENYVAQWGDGEQLSSKQKSLGTAKKEIKVEFFRSLEDVNFVPINSRDAYADTVGFVEGFPAASDGKRVWLTHCYGMVGVSRGLGDSSGNGSGLYVVTGHAPRHLDRNVTLVGRVLSGMPVFSTLARGTGPLGFYENADEWVPIHSVSLGHKTQKKLGLSVMNTAGEAFAEHVKKRTTRSEEWFLESTGKIELCNVGIPSRAN